MSTDATASAYPADPTMLSKGLTKREYIAAIALSATNPMGSAQERAQEAVGMADALIKVLNT